MSYMTKNTLVIADIDAHTMKQLRKELNDLPKVVQQELRKRNRADAAELKKELIMASYDPAAPPQAPKVAKAATPMSDRNIRIRIGGSKKIGRPYKDRKTKEVKRATAGRLLYGSEHGSSGTGQDKSGRAMGKRFVSPSKPAGYWIAPTVAEFGKEIADKWEKRVTKLLKDRRLT